MNKKAFKFLVVCFALLAMTSMAEAAGRLNFMLTNVSGHEITGVTIAPTYYPQNQTENLLNTGLESNTRLYIGPNYYGSQSYWNITLTWSNGFSKTWTHNRLTRYNSYTAYIAHNGDVRLRQGYERAFARYGNQYASTYSSPYNSQVNVALGAPEKVNVAGASRSQGQMVASNTRRTTRDLVFDDEDEQEVPAAEGSAAANAKGKSISVKATVELTRDGAMSTVLPSADFKSGDRVRLVFSSNSDGYVYWVTKGTTGTYQVLFPGKKTGMDNAVARNKEYTIPAKGAWRFDDNKGTETLVCLLAPNKIPELEKAIQEANGGDKTAASATIAAVVTGHETQRTTRDLVFEEEDVDDVNTKVQTSSGDEPFVATYELNHL